MLNANITKIHTAIMQFRCHITTLPMSNFLRQPPFDLFGQIPVTDDDIYAWVECVAPRWLYPVRSFNNYVKNWDVAGKVRAAKERGEFDSITNRPRPAWHVRLAMGAVL